MLTQHTYWNLDAFANPTTDRIWNHTYYTPFSQRHLEPDANMVPTGKIPKIPKGDINDFWSKPKQLGTNMNDPKWVGNCGTGSGCQGYNNLWVVDKARADPRIAATLASKWSGIKVDVRTDQQGMQLYTCYWSGGMPFLIVPPQVECELMSFEYRKWKAEVDPGWACEQWVCEQWWLCGY